MSLCSIIVLRELKVLSIAPSYNGLLIMLTFGLHNRELYGSLPIMRDKLKKKKVTRFDYYGFLFEKKLYKEFLIYCADNHLSSSSRKVRHNFIKSRGLWNELKHSKYDARIAEVINEPWVRDENDNLIIRKI